MNADVAALIIDSKSTQLTEPALDSDTLGIDLIRNQDKLNSTLHSLVTQCTLYSKSNASKIKGQLMH